jgi:hypothetical protein
MKTGFAFDINCDFQPDQNRKQLIFDEDDEKGKYNRKIFKFVPCLLHEILNDLKEEISAELLYKVLSSSEPDGNFTDLFCDFIDTIKDNDDEIIFINNQWHSPSKTCFC